MQIQILEGIAYVRDGNPMHASVGDIVEFDDVEAEQLIAANVAVKVEDEPEAPKKKRVV
jgi:hypothetical protein